MLPSGLITLLLVFPTSAPSTDTDPAIEETLVYHAEIAVASAWITLGEATLTRTRPHHGEITLVGRARGEKLGYVLDCTVRARVESAGGMPREYHYRQLGSEPREKKLLFKSGGDGVVYVKRKHCRLPGCQDPAHHQESEPGAKLGTHCRGDGCDDPAHHIWQERGRHQLERRHFDLLTAISRARTFDFVDGPGEWTVPVVVDRDLWQVAVQIVGREEVEVAGERTRAAVLTLSPTASNPDESDPDAPEFEGLFGLQGALRVWVEETTGCPLRVTGELPLGSLRLPVRAELIRREKAHAPQDTRD